MLQPSKATRFSPLHRPLFPQSKKNAETLDVQAEKDKAAFSRLQNTHLKNAGAQHHAMPQKDVFAPQPEGIHTDMTGKPTKRQGGYMERQLYESQQGVRNPITNEYKVVGSHALEEQSRPSTANRYYTLARQVREAQGNMNPLTGEWQTPQDPSIAKERERMFKAEQIIGRGEAVGLAQ